MITYNNLYNYLLINIKEKTLVLEIMNTYCDILLIKYKKKFNDELGNNIKYLEKFMRDAESPNTLFYLWLVKKNILNETFSKYLINKNPIANIKDHIKNTQNHLYK